MKKLMVTAAVAAAYLLISLVTGLWALTWIIWVFYGIWMLVQLFRDGEE